MKHPALALAILALAGMLTGCSALVLGGTPSASISWRCTVQSSPFADEGPDSYELDITNPAGSTLTIAEAEVGIFDSSGTEIGTQTPTPLPIVVAANSTYDDMQHIFTSEISGTAYSCKLLTWSST